jgi:hypothetical protein
MKQKLLSLVVWTYTNAYALELPVTLVVALAAIFTA